MQMTFVAFTELQIKLMAECMNDSVPVHRNLTKLKEWNGGNTYYRIINDVIA